MFKCKTQRNPWYLDGRMNVAPWHSVQPDGISPFVRGYAKVKTPGVLGDQYRKGSTCARGMGK